MKHLTKRVSSLALTLILAFSLTATAFAEDEAAPSYEGWDTIKVFETTDVHGSILDVSTYVDETFQYRMAYIAKLVEDARANEAYDGVLLLDAGDTFQGTPHSNLTYGASLLAMLDEMEYDAIGLGNHEFDWDVTKYIADSEGTLAAYELGEYSGDSDIPVLAYNIYDAGTTDLVDFVQEYTVVEKGGYTVTILGYVPDYSADIMAEKIAPYTIDEDLEKLEAKALAVREETEADVLVILAHASAGPVAEAMDPEVVDLVLGGHSHGRECGVAENGIAYIQGGSNAYGYATAEIKIDPETKEVAVVGPEYVNTTTDENLENLYYKDGANEALDPDVAAISVAAWDAVKEEMYEVLCTVDGDITKSPIQEGTTTSVAGNWLTGLMLEATKELDTIAAFTNSGGIRTNLVRAEGAETRDITVADIYTIAPFSNQLWTYAITGAQLAAHLENALQGSYENSNYGDQFSGIVVTYKKNADGIDVTGIVTDDGEAIDIDDTTTLYNVVVNQYNATLAGSVFEELTPIQDPDLAPIDNLSAIEALRALREANGLEMALDTTVRAVEDTTAAEEPAEPAGNVVIGETAGTAHALTAEDVVYYRLRDVATVLKGTEAAFNVDWDGGVVITKGGEYTAEALAAPAEGSTPVARTTITVTVDGAKVEVTVLNLYDHNYVSAEGLAALLGVTATVTDGVLTVAPAA